MTTTECPPCDFENDEACPRLVPEVVADLAELIGRPVRVTAGAVAYHAILKDVEDGPTLVLRGHDWTRRVPLSACRQVAESKVEVR